MSDALYNSLQEKWREWLETEFYPGLESYTPDEASEEYDDLAHDFCKEYGYSEKTQEFAFHKRWYDTFADMYYTALEKHGRKIQEQEQNELNLRDARAMEYVINNDT